MTRHRCDSRRHPPPNPAELRALWTRVYHRKWAGSREMFEKIGNAWVRRLKGLRGRQRRFLRVAQTWQTASCRSKTQRKNTSFHTSFDSPQTLTAPQRQTTRGETLLFCDAYRSKNFDPPQPHNGPRSPKNLENELLGSFFSFDDRVADGRKHSAKMERLEISKNMHFCNVLLFFVQEAHFGNTVSQTTCIFGPSTGCLI